MKKILNIALAATLLFGFASCEDWMDVNTSPDAPVTVTCDVVLPTVLFYAAQQQYDFAEYGVYLSQCLTTTGKSLSSSTAYKSGWGGFLTMNRHPQWRRCYYDIGVNTTYMLEDAEARGMRNYILIGKTLLINSLLTTTDLFGEVPVHESYAYATSIEGRTPNPRYEEQKDVYAYIQQQFEELLPLYEDPEWIECPTNGVITRQADRIFGGDLTQWRALTKALYARFLVRNIPNMNNTPAMCDKIIAAVDDALNDPGWQALSALGSGPGARGVVYKFDGGSAEKCCMWGPSQPKMNLGWPQARENLLTSAVPSTFFASILGFYPKAIAFGRNYKLEKDENGTVAEKRRILMYALDPRAELMMEARNDDKSVKALRSIRNNIGMDIEYAVDYKMDYFPDLFTTSDQYNPYTRDDGYISFITEEELLFIKAEALYWKGDKTRSYDEMVKAVETSFARYGVYGKAGHNRDADGNDLAYNVEKEAIAVFKELRLPAGEYSIAHLMQQKYVAMYLQAEQWNDIRRYNYSSTANGIMYDNQYVYNVDNVFNSEYANVAQIYFDQEFSLVRPYNIYTPEWDTPMDKGKSFKLSPYAWINRISADPETEEKYNRDELIRWNAFQNPNWLRKRQVWQLPTNPGSAITNYGDSEDWSKWN